MDEIKGHLPCYYYDGEMILAQCHALKNALMGFDFLYSIKTNPFEPIVADIAGEGFGGDAASVEEVEISLRNGMAPEAIFYSAPGKSEADIKSCFGRCVLIADSFTEIARINAEAQRHNRVEKIGIRVNPQFTMEQESGQSSKFGIDSEQMDELEVLLAQCNHISVVGVHIHIKSQELDFKKLGGYYQNCFQLAQELNALDGIELAFINFGSGIGALYDACAEAPVDLKRLADMLETMVAENRKSLGARLYIETGRFLVCNAGTYYTEIIDIKKSRGRKYLIVKNAMNGFLRPAIAGLLESNCEGRAFAGQEPLYASNHAFQISVLNEETETERVDIVGNLCTALDILGRDVEVRRGNIGDIVAVSNAGSYGYALSPLLFSGHSLPKQLYKSPEREKDTLARYRNEDESI